MKQAWFGGLVIGVVACGVVFSSLRVADAQSSALTGKVAAVDVLTVFNEYQKQKDLFEEIRGTEDALGTQANEKRQRIDSLQATLDQMAPDDPQAGAKARDLLALQIDYKNWMDLKQAEMSREVAVWTAQLYRDINAKIAEIAERDGYDVVVMKQEFQRRSADPQQVQGQIESRKVLYVKPAADITQIILNAVNEDYRQQPRRKLLQIQ